MADHRLKEVKMFTDSKFMSAKDKEKVLEAWETFLKYGLQEKHFTKRLYDHLTLRASFIAHYSQTGFYSYYFTSPEKATQFISQFDHDKNYLTTEYGDDYWVRGEYKKINLAMCDVMEKYKVGLYANCKGEEFKGDMAIVTGLMAKHGIN